MPRSPDRGRITDLRRDGLIEPTGERRKKPETGPCQKPVPLLRACIRLVAPRGGHILDPFAGIGSTGVAAVEEGCAFTGIELDPRYVKLSRARVVEAAKIKTC